MTNLFNYIDRPSPIHRLTGATKFACLLLWSFAAMVTYDTRMLAAMTLMSLVLFRLSRLRLTDVRFMMGLTGVFLLINTVMLYVFSPQHGTQVYGTIHVVFGKGRFALTWEQLFYQFNYILKFCASIPIVLLFVCTTNPSEFAASLNKLGVKYSVAYSVALALRYIPDVQQEYHEISQAQQARGIEMSKKASAISRLRSVSSILIPLILSSMEKVEVISNAMELRSFGKNKKRTWYMGRPFRAADIGAMVFCGLLVVLALVLNRLNGSRFYNPFL